MVNYFILIYNDIDDVVNNFILIYNDLDDVVNSFILIYNDVYDVVNYFILLYADIVYSGWTWMHGTHLSQCIHIRRSFSSP